ncbi:MAG: YebC/PmpR family DNA-binding transcriptional regulator, partial [bacterium]
QFVLQGGAMSGHSKWATIKRKKAKSDDKRGKVFSKIAREITIAAKIGGGDVSGNPRLRFAVDKAREANMPADNIGRAIQKGAGGGEGSNVEEITLEGYGPGGVAVMVKAMTDNRNRTVSDLRHEYSRHGGNLGEAGCVSWMFKEKGLIQIEKSKASEEQVMELAVEAGAEDIRSEADSEVIEVETTIQTFEKVKEALSAKFPIASAEITMIPQNTIALTGEDAQKIIKLMTALEDHDDVHDVYANFDIPDEMAESI